MRKNLKLFIGLAVVAGVGLLVAKEVRRRRRLKKVSDNGYETAHDVLYPHRKGSHRKLRYGPVLPG